MTRFRYHLLKKIYFKIQFLLFDKINFASENLLSVNFIMKSGKFQTKEIFFSVSIWMIEFIYIRNLYVSFQSIYIINYYELILDKIMQSYIAQKKHTSPQLSTINNCGIVESVDCGET